MNYKLSPSELTYLYEGCKACFWLKVKHGIAQPSMPMPGIFSAIAGLQKGFYQDKRTEEFCPELPPGIVHLGEEWVQSEPITVPGMADQCHIRGRFDVVVKFDDGSYGVIDFKTARPSEGKIAMYGRQLQAYAYALENAATGEHCLSPVTRLGLLFFSPDCFEQSDLTHQSFKGKVTWAEVRRDDDQFLSFIREVMAVLDSERPPSPSADCHWCQYREKMRGFDFNHPGGHGGGEKTETGSPNCPKCGSAMRRRNGKFGEFWSCSRYPECRGTRNIAVS